MTMPVRDDARTVVTVQPAGRWHHLAGTCGDAPAPCSAGRLRRARLGLTLDNRAPQPGDPVPVDRSATPPVQVAARDRRRAAGDVVDVDVPLVAREPGPGRRHGGRRGDPSATSDWYTCGRFAATPPGLDRCGRCCEPLRSLILDNSRSTARLRLHLPAHPDVVLGAGDARTLRLHLPIASRVAVTAPGLGEGGRPLDLAVHLDRPVRRGSRPPEHPLNTPGRRQRAVPPPFG